MQRKEIPAALSVVVSKEPPRVSACYEPSARTFSAGSVLDGSGRLTEPNPRCRGDCRKLKGKGYDAYVVAAEVKSKIWHRVRVGQGVDLSEAFELRARLKAKENFDQAFIALR